jgi:ATP-dependent DNA helicase DinG
MPDISDLLGERGPLARCVAGFAARPQQQEMAGAVAEALEDYDVLITEAGTGTGKTFAYLVPALLCGGKVIVSTGTKNLQDQLFGRDLPLVRDALQVSVRCALLKGRANYLCLHRLALSEQRARSPDQAALLARVRVWAELTETADLAELPDIPEDAAVWSQVTSTADNCLGQECPDLSACFVFKARRRAQEADLLVINHHLLCADIALRGEGLGELLPGASAVIVDEAHQLPETATQFFGMALGSGQLLELARDSVAEHAREAGDMPDLVAAAGQLERATQRLHLALGEPRRAPWAEVWDLAAVTEALGSLHQSLDTLCRQLDIAAPRGKGLESCSRRAEDLRGRLRLVLPLDGPAQPAEDPQTPESESAPLEQVRWMELRPRSFSVYLTPLDISDAFNEHVYARKCAWVFTSATLAVGDSFEHFAARLGLTDASTRRWDSPFDFERQALLYIPRGLPDPNALYYHQAVIEAALPVLRSSRGRAFLLFTSHKALRKAEQMLTGRIDYPLLVQGSAPRAVLLERFRRLGNAVLLGTSSFWEGVDVRGEALSLVVIDRLPFASPGDPVLRARVESMRRQGADPFMEYQLPHAVITLKQGAGRLIRDAQDRGVLMLCDPRLFSKGYGRIFLASLPPMPLTREIEDVRRFFAADRAPEQPEQGQSEKTGRSRAMGAP